jgi:small subunit ribosomal protein S17
MADEEKNETTDETTETTAAEEVSAPVEEASDSPETVDEAARAEEVSDTPAPEATPAPAAREKPKKSLKHVPRSLRRTRTRPKREAPKTRKPITRTEKPATELGRRQERRGVVVSDKGDKTIVVKVDVIKSHPKYKKVVRSTVKFHAHDEQNTAGVGDTVRIVETRPLSKTKRWRLAEIVEKAR